MLHWILSRLQVSSLSTGITGKVYDKRHSDFLILCPEHSFDLPILHKRKRSLFVRNDQCSVILSWLLMVTAYFLLCPQSPTSQLCYKTPGVVGACQHPLLSPLKSKTFAFLQMCTVPQRCLRWLSNLSAASPLSTHQVTSSHLCATLSSSPTDQVSLSQSNHPSLRQSLALRAVLNSHEHFTIRTCLQTCTVLLSLQKQL